MTFARNVKALAGAIDDIGNQFAEKGSDLLVPDTRNLADTAVIECLYHIQKLGQDQYNSYMYVTEHLVSQIKPITDPIQRNNLRLFS